MPSNLVKTKADEKLWEEAKKAADKSNIKPKSVSYYAYAVSIFEKMKRGKNK